MTHNNPQLDAEALYATLAAQIKSALASTENLAIVLRRVCSFCYPPEPS